MNIEVFVHTANVLYLFSYLVRDILWLRVLTVVAATTLIPFFYFRPEPEGPLWAPIIWNFVFTAINAWQIRTLLLARRPVRLEQREEDLYRMAFRALTPREFSRLLGAGSWETADASECLVERDAALDHLMMIYQGKARVVVDDETIADLDPGSFVGEISFLTGDTPSASVYVNEPSSYVSWPTEALQALLGRNPELRSSLQFILGSDMAAKLRAPAAARGENS